MVLTPAESGTPLLDEDAARRCTLAGPPRRVVLRALGGFRPGALELHQVLNELTSTCIVAGERRLGVRGLPQHVVCDQYVEMHVVGAGVVGMELVGATVQSAPKLTQLVDVIAERVVRLGLVPGYKL
jgi:hypothetical protein